MKWFFDGLGTEIFSVIVGLLLGGFGGYRIGIKKNIKQSQKSRDNSSQLQIGEIHGDTNTKIRK